MHHRFGGRATSARRLGSWLIAGLPLGLLAASYCEGQRSASATDGVLAKSGPMAASHREAMRSGSSAADKDPRTAWYEDLPQGLRDVGCDYDNGAPLDDTGAPASQLSTMSQDPDWNFIAAAADDFTLTGGTAGMDCHIATVRAAFQIFNLPGSGSPRTLFQGIYVTVYPDVSGKPGGTPTSQPEGGQMGNYIVSRFVPVSSLANETLVGTCSGGQSYRVDIPVDITLAKGVKYWLSLVPKFTGPPQAAWTLSQSNTDLPAEQYFPPFFNMWTAITGNDSGCPGAPPATTKRDLAFMLLGSETVAVSGACCTDSTTVCQDSVSELACQQTGQRFVAGGTCAAMNPPCGSGVGGCCLPDGVCQSLNPSDCQNSGGTWGSTPCDQHPCVPLNGLCANAILVSNGMTVFDTTGAVTDGPTDAPATGCTQVNQDIWFKYTSNCTGTVTVSLCGSTYDTSMDVYQGWGCGASIGTRLACNNDFAGCGTASQVNFSATNNGQYLIRVGGTGTATGMGTMSIDCVASGSGACCFPDGHCEVTTQSSCTASQGVFTADHPCLPGTCPPLNDLCANAVFLSSGVHPFDTRGATTDGPDETPTCPAIHQDIWYKWTADCDGSLSVQLCEDTDFDASLAIYDGTTCPPASRIGCNDNGCGTGSQAPKLSVPVVNGHTYLIRVGGVGAATGTGKIRLGCVPTGMGACCHQNLSCDQLTQADCSAAGGTFFVGQVCAPGLCVPQGGGCCLGDIDANGTVDVNDVQPFSDLLLSPPSSGDPAFCRADINLDGKVDGLDIAPFMQRVLSQTPCQVAPANDVCASAILISNMVTLFDTTGAGTDGPTDSPVGCTNVNQDIWFKYTAACTGQLTASLCSGTSYNAAMEVYAGCTCENLGAPLACDNDSCGTTGGPSTVTLSVSQGQCYLIRVGGEGAAVAAGQLTVTCSPSGGTCCRGDIDGNNTIDINDVQPFTDALIVPPANNTIAFCRADINQDSSVDGRDIASFMQLLLNGATCTVAPLNDLCANAIMVTSTLTPFDTTGAATDGPSDAPPCPAIGQDIWYRYTASCNGMLTVDLCQGTAFDAALAIYDGCTCPPTLLLGCDDNSCGGVAPSQSVSVVNGHCYLIRVGGVGSATGTGNVHVVCTPTTGTGACCKTDLSCEVLPPADCQIANGTFHGDGTICTPELCAPSLPPPACSGDVNGDCQVDDTDIPLFVQALLDPTLQSAEVCRADANGDGVLDGKDIQVFIDNVIAHCHCCHGDTNHDGKLDGLDIQGLINAVMAQSSPLAGCAYYYEPTADVNNDGIINVIDIDVFVNLLVNGGTCAP